MSTVASYSIQLLLLGQVLEGSSPSRWLASQCSDELLNMQHLPLAFGTCSQQWICAAPTLPPTDLRHWVIIRINSHFHRVAWSYVDSRDIV